MINLCCCGLQGCPGQIQRAILFKDGSGAYGNADNKYAPIFAINNTGGFSSGDLTKFTELEFLTGNYNLVVTGQLSDNSSQITASSVGQRWKATSTGSAVANSHPSGFSFIIQSGSFNGEKTCNFEPSFVFSRDAVLGGSEEISFNYHRRNILLEYNSQGDAIVPGTDIQQCNNPPSRGCPPKQAPPSTALAAFILNGGPSGPIFPRSLYGGRQVYSGSGPCAVASTTNDTCGATNLASIIKADASPSFSNFSINSVFWTCDTSRERCYSTLSGSAFEPFVYLVEGEIPLGIKMKFNKGGIIRNVDSNIVFTINGSKPLYGRTPGTSCEINEENTISGFVNEIATFSSGEEITINSMNFLVFLNGNSSLSGMQEVVCGVLKRANDFHALAIGNFNQQTTFFHQEFQAYSALPSSDAQALAQSLGLSTSLIKGGSLKFIFD